jgi:phosphoenolpyruvate carboxylase
MDSAAFSNEVDLKYKLYNSIFLTLPHDGVHGTGILIPILNTECVTGFQEGKSPVEILDGFFEKHTSCRTEKEKQDFIFRVIQYVERQVVLMDAVEDAAFEKLTEQSGPGSFHSLVDQVSRENKWEELRSSLQHYGVRIVLTAHPTQFYPGTVLGIINDLIGAVRTNDVQLIQTLLRQLGKTPFFKKEKPTPYDEAINLTWYLEHIFYDSAAELCKKVQLKSGLAGKQTLGIPSISFGFWPGGDRDGNPFVKADTTLQVADNLRRTILACYYGDIRKLKRRLTFKDVYDTMFRLEKRLQAALNEPDPAKRIHLPEFIEELDKVEVILEKEHDSYFLGLFRDFRIKVQLFGFHFASIDIRQDSRIIKAAFDSLLQANPGLNQKSESLTADELFAFRGKADLKSVDDPVLRDTLESFEIVREIQRRNGEAGCHRFIISNCNQPEDVARIFAMARLNNTDKELHLDIVPLFETIGDLENACYTMEVLYSHPVYKQHLLRRNNRQTIMLGFSDGTKDGGYFAANWNIYRAKENITRLSRTLGIEVVFFDGRGGPPSRGGENTHKFYSSLGSDIENKEIQVTIQGQTISSKFGTQASAGYYMELLLTAGLENLLFRDELKQLTPNDRDLMDHLARWSMDSYRQFRQSKEFLPYLERMTVLRYYSMANIGSRPSSRSGKSKMEFEDLRAIPFVGSWAQMKQNVPGFFGVGSSLKKLEEAGRLEECRDLYQRSRFFRTLVENSMQSLEKSYFELTRYIEKDPEFSDFWKWIYNEYLLSSEMLLKISGHKILMENTPFLRNSIALRASIVLPLVTIQQYAMMKIREMAKGGKQSAPAFSAYEKIVIRSIYGNINASRNSA